MAVTATDRQFGLEDLPLSQSMRDQGVPLKIVPDKAPITYHNNEVDFRICLIATLSRGAHAYQVDLGGDSLFHNQGEIGKKWNTPWSTLGKSCLVEGSLANWRNPDPYSDVSDFGLVFFSEALNNQQNFNRKVEVLYYKNNGNQRKVFDTYNKATEQLLPFFDRAKNHHSFPVFAVVKPALSDDSCCPIQ